MRIRPVEMSAAAPPAVPEPRIFLNLVKNSRGDRVQVRESVHEGKPYIEIAVFHPGRHGALVRSKEGVNLRPQHLQQIAEALLAAAKELQS